MLKKILPLIVIAAMAGGAWVVFNNPPEVNRSPRKPSPAMTVQVEKLKLEDYQIQIERYGRVVAQQRTPLMAEASGEILYLSPKLKAGGSFTEGELLIRLDDSRYQAELAIAESTLTENLENYAEQQALAEQARQAWLLSGQTGEPSDRVLRKPQLRAALAQVQSARSSVKLAQLSLAKTRILAPFDASVATLNVEKGQAISSGAEIAVLIVNSAPEIDVALHQRDLDYVDLELIGGSSSSRIPAQITDNGITYSGFIARTAAELEAASQQLMARVQLENSFSDGVEKVSKWPRVGSLVKVSVQGKTLNDVLVIPTPSVYQSRYVYRVVDGRLQKQEVVLGWQDDRFSVVKSGLEIDDQLVVTPLGQVASGTLVSIASAETEKEEPEQ
ncbi:efflux RND transporter periplasmic adaptor subunit [Oceanospirillum sp. HFRX-1_2]